jgi:hypothetical protein
MVFMTERGLLLGAIVACMASASAADEHAINPEPELLPAGLVQAATREVCTTSDWGFDEVRTQCDVQVLSARRSNPALKGICTTYYGNRTCY